MDDGKIPKVKDIGEFLSLAVQRGYIEETALKGLNFSSFSTYIVHKANVGAIQELPIKSSSNSLFSKGGFEKIFKEIRSPDKVLYLTKESSDIRLNWTGSGTLYDCAIAKDIKFQEGVQTLFLDLNSTTYLYKNGVVNGIDFIAFDVTDEVEQNKGGNYNGGILPPPPPIIDKSDPETNIGNLYIGSNGVIKGNNFSEIEGENLICFEDGICIYPDIATQNRLDFKVPLGASSGNITVDVRGKVSEPEEGKVNLEDTASGWTIRTMGYSKQSGEYWFAGLSSSVNSIYRLYYNSSTGKWVREDRKGGMSAQILYCSTRTDSSGRLFCGYGATGTGGGGTRYVQTNPPGNLTNCINLGGSGESTQVRGAAVDGVRGYVYFAHYYARVPTAEGYIKKIDTNCTSVIDSDYGNQNGSWGPIWNTIVGMVSDETNGDLYVASKTGIYKVDLSENVSLVKAGFSNIYGIDLIRETSQEPGFLVIADQGTGMVNVTALDNLSSTPIDIASASNLRAVLWGRKVGNNIEVNAENEIFLALLHNSGNTGATSPIRANPMIEIMPRQNNNIWISAPEGGREGQFPQGYIRASYPPGTDKSTGIVKMKYKDNKERYTCARTGDPGKAAPYDPSPSDLTKCDKPYRWVNSICDNKDNFTTGTYGVGSFVGTGNFTSCKVCGSDSNICKFEFWITSRYAGDNYKIYFQTFEDDNLVFLERASPIYTAEKHIHIERDKMCRNGGLLKQDALAGQSTIYLAMNPDGTRADNINQGDIIHIFDSDTLYEKNHDMACVKFLQEDSENKRVKIDLGLDSDCNTAYALTNNYYSDHDGSDLDPHKDVWDFTSGNSAGVCKNDNLFYIPDTSDLSQPFSDAYVSFHITADGIDGSSVVPYLPKEFFDGYEVDGECPKTKAKDGYSFMPWGRFGKIWFKNKDIYNHLQVIGVGNTQQLGECTVCSGSWPAPQILAQSLFYGTEEISNKQILVFREAIEYPCATASQIENATRQTVNHEVGHQFYLNPTIGWHDCRCSWPNLSQPPTCPANDTGSCDVQSCNNCCVMCGGKRDLWNYSFKFDANDIICGDSGCPNGKGGCCSSCSMPGNGSIRQLYDPLKGFQP